MKSFWGWFDVMYIILNGVINIGLLSPGSLIGSKSLRLIASLLSIVIIVKLLYYMQLMDSVAPLVNIIILIFYDIGWFVIVLVLTMWGFSTAFYLIGKNQYWHWHEHDRIPCLEKGISEDDCPT